MFHSGAVYDGEWKDDRRHGLGTLIDAKGNSYTGEWRNDCRDGKGNLVCHQKRQRLIDVETGEESFPKQMRLISHMSDRVKEAEEGLESRLKEAERVIEEDVVDEVVKYSGQLKYGMLEGAGVLYYGTGDCYKGMFHQNYRDGRGTYTFKNYSLYGRRGEQILCRGPFPRGSDRRCGNSDSGHKRESERKQDFYACRPSTRYNKGGSQSCRF